MPALSGREALLKKGATTIAGVRTKTISWSGGSIDVTTGEDSGKRTLLALSGQEQIDITFDGLAKDDTIREIAMSSSSKMLTDITLDMGDAVISGSFRISSYEEGFPYNDAATFSATLESSGAWVYNPDT